MTIKGEVEVTSAAAAAVTKYSVYTKFPFFYTYSENHLVGKLPRRDASPLLFRDHNQRMGGKKLELSQNQYKTEVFVPLPPHP